MLAFDTVWDLITEEALCFRSSASWARVRPARRRTPASQRARTSAAWPSAWSSTRCGRSIGAPRVPQGRLSRRFGTGHLGAPADPDADQLPGDAQFLVD